MSGESEPSPVRKEVVSDENARREAAEWGNQKHRAQVTDLGWLGKMFGGGDEKAGDIAGLMVVFGFMVIAFLLVTEDMWENIDATVALLGATLTACLGYLFGRK